MCQRGQELESKREGGRKRMREGRRNSRRQSDTERDRHIGTNSPEGDLARDWNG